MFENIAISLTPKCRQFPKPIVVGFLILLFSIQALLSAEISFFQPADAETACSVQISGTVVPGDYEKFESVLIENGWYDPNNDYPPYDSRGREICLNSPGGAFVDGIQISRLVRKVGAATYIENGKECFSVCAIIFMSGATIAEEGGEGYHNRTLHVGGRLGFHAPYYVKSALANLESEELAQLIDIYRLFVVELIAQSRIIAPDSVFPATPASLLEQLMNAGPDQMVEVDTIDEIGRWNIAITGFDGFDYAGAGATFGQLCVNWSSWIFDKKSRNEPGDVRLSLNEIDLTRYPDYQRNILEKIKIYRYTYWEYIPAYCDMGFLSDKTVFLSLVDNQRGVEFPWWRIPSFLALPPETKLRSLLN